MSELTTLLMVLLAGISGFVITYCWLEKLTGSARQILVTTNVAKLLRTKGIPDGDGKLVTYHSDRPIFELNSDERKTFFATWPQIVHATMRIDARDRVLYVGRLRSEFGSKGQDYEYPIFNVVKFGNGAPYLDITPWSPEGAQIEAIAQKYDEEWKRRSKGA